MREFFLKIINNDNFPNLEITLFSGWHFMYIILIVGLPILFSFLFRKKSEEFKQKFLSVLAISLISVYILDIFCMPLSEGRIDIDKLPFHICTIMGIFVPFAQFNKKFEKIKPTIVCLTLVASLMYVTYPGSALGDISAFAYKVVQTFVYHGLMFAWGLMSMTLGDVKLDIKKIWKEAVAIVLIIIWAEFGNIVYSSDTKKYDWFFVTGRTFGIDKYVMPFVVLASVFGMCAIIYGIYYLVVYLLNKKDNGKSKEISEKSE